jgi:hypothetical protein
MKKENYQWVKRAILSSILIGSGVYCSAVEIAEMNPVGELTTQAVKSSEKWTEFHSVTGKCSMLFPVHPSHVTETMNVPEEGYDLKYDAYISSEDKKTVYMLLIAQYPEFVDESYGQMSLEGFLNGILTHSPGNQLIFADLLLVNGREALDFFIRTGSVYFRGRALMVKNHLYLMAMECEVQTYDEMSFNVFINSFQLKH